MEHPPFDRIDVGASDALATAELFLVLRAHRAGAQTLRDLS